MKNLFKKLGLASSLIASVFINTRLYAAYGNPVMDVRNPESTAEYITVQNGAAEVLEVGDVVVFQIDTTYGIEVVETTTANNGLVAGVIAQKDCAVGDTCVVQTRGYNGAVNVDVATSAGDTLVTSGTGEFSTVYTVAQSTGTSANQSRAAGPFAVALEATTSSTTVKAFLFGR